MLIKLQWSVRQLLLDAFMFTVEYKLLGNTSLFAASLPRNIKDKEYDYLNTFLINSVKSFNCFRLQGSKQSDFSALFYYYLIRDHFKYILNTYKLAQVQ